MVHKIGVHACPDCPKTFSRLEYVARHRRLKHLGIRPWCCECGTSYARSDLLTRHRKKCEGKVTTTSNGGSRSRSKDRRIPAVPSPEYNSRSTPPPLNISTSSPPGQQSSGAGAGAGPLLYDDNAPPTYRQAIMNQAPPPTAAGHGVPHLLFPQSGTCHLSNASSSAHPHPSGTFPTNNNSAILSPAVETQQYSLQKISPNSALYHNNNYPVVEFDLDGREGPTESLQTNTSLMNDETDVVGREDQQNEGDQVFLAESSNDSSLTTSMADPFDSVIPYIQPNFFINDVPETSPFYLNPNVWVLAFLCQRSQGFTIPHLGTLSRFVSRAIQVICPVIPMIHVPTFKTTMTTIHLGYALSVAGAASENSDHAIAFTDQSLTYKRPLVQNDFLSRNNGFNFRFELLQALLIYQFIGMFSHLETQRNRSIEFSKTIVEDFRDLGFVESLRNTPDYIHLALSGQVPLDLGWKLWVNYEVKKRTAFLALISSLQLKGTTELEIKLADADLPLPCHEDLWQAESAEEWIRAAREQAIGRIIENGRGRSHRGGAGNVEVMMGQHTEPLLSEALAALSLSDLPLDTNNNIPSDFLGLTLPQSQNAPLTFRLDRFGGFAKAVLHHTRSLTRQATVRSGRLL